MISHKCSRWRMCTSHQGLVSWWQEASNELVVEPRCWPTMWVWNQCGFYKASHFCLFRCICGSEWSIVSKCKLKNLNIIGHTLSLYLPLLHTSIHHFSLLSIFTLGERSISGNPKCCLHVYEGPKHTLFKSNTHVCVDMVYFEDVTETTAFHDSMARDRFSRSNEVETRTCLIVWLVPRVWLQFP